MSGCGHCPAEASPSACTAAPSGVRWLMCYSIDGIAAIGSHSPAKNIIGKNTSAPIG